MKPFIPDKDMVSKTDKNIYENRWLKIFLFQSLPEFQINLAYNIFTNLNKVRQALGRSQESYIAIHIFLLWLI